MTHSNAVQIMKFAPIQILEMRFLRGPNIWTYRSVIEAIVDIGALEGFPSNTLPGFYERLVAWLPGLIEHRCSVGRRGGFLMRLRDGTWPGHILEHVALELQSLAGMKTGFGKARMTPVEGIYKVVIRTREESVGRAALTSARDLVMAAINDTAFDVPNAVATLTDLVDRRWLGPSTACIVEAATERGIPHLRLNEANLVQLGYGAKQRRIWTAETDKTSAIAEGISRDKELTKQLLRDAGIPVPSGMKVNSQEEAWDAAQELGMPVVVKPVDGNHARGVSLNLTTQEEIARAYTAAEAEGSEVLVERFIPGQEHRLLVVGNKVVAATRGEIISVHGDGQSSIAQLIASQVNTDPRRGDEEALPLEPLRMDDAVLMLLLQAQGLSADAVLPRGKAAVVQRTGNMAVDVTAQVHPDTAELAALAARVVGLDIAGLDLVAEDISQPLSAQAGAIVEVNAGPGLLMHLKPAVGQAQPVGDAIVQHLFPNAADGRIPIVGVVGGEVGCLTSQLIGHLLQAHGLHTAVSDRAGLSLGGRRLRSGDATAYAHAERMLINRTVEALVCETTPRAILTEGLPYDRCSVGVVLSIPAASGLQDLYVQDDDQMPNVIRTQVDVVLPQGAAVLNGESPSVAALADYCDGEVIFFGATPSFLNVNGPKGRAMYVQEGVLCAQQNGKVTELLTLPSPANPAEVAAAAAAAWALGVPLSSLPGAILRFFEINSAPAVH